MGELGLPNNRMFLRILVIERSLHFASLAICDVESVLATDHVYNHPSLPSIHILCHYVTV